MTFQTREEWFRAAMVHLGGDVFLKAGYDIPKNIRIGVGWPGGSKIKTMATCWSKIRSADDTHEIFISPISDQPVDILRYLVHEICHAIVGVEVKHKKSFIEVMQAVGMVKKWTGSNASEGLLVKLTNIAEKLGEYPHKKLSPQDRIGKKQTTRLIKIQCPECEYILRVARKPLEEWGSPLCPIHKIAFRESSPFPEPGLPKSPPRRPGSPPKRK